MFNSRNDTLIQELRSQRKAAIEAFNTVNLAKNNSIAEFFYEKFQTGQDVPYALLEDMPTGEPFLLPVVYGGAIVTTKIKESIADEVMYTTEWTPGSTLTWHFHSDCIEQITVVSGKVKIYVQGSVHEITTEQTVTIGAGVGHQVTALDTSKLVIKFKKE